MGRLDAERVAGLKVRGLGSEHLYGERLPLQARWTLLRELTAGVGGAGWRALLRDLGYTISALPRRGHLCSSEGRPVLVVHPCDSAARFARLDEQGRLPDGALISACRRHGARYGLLAAGPRLRLHAAGDDDAGRTTRYLELDAAALASERRPLLGLLAPEYLADGGLDALLTEARDDGRAIRGRVDAVLRQDVLPRLALGLGRWAREQGLDPDDDDTREELEAAALVFVLRSLFLRHAESTGERAWDPLAHGDLFAAGHVKGASLLKRAALTGAELAPALVALARDAEDAVDFSGLEIGHLGDIYEGLLSLRLSPADRDYVYDVHLDRYVAATPGQQPEVRSGELLWLTNEGGRKGGGVYYTRTEIVRHLVRRAVGPAFDRHLAEIRALAREDATAAAARLFAFYVLDPACGSGHFLVEVVDELTDKIATLLGEVALPAIRAQLEALRSSAGTTRGSGIEDTALLKQLVLERCVYGVDLSPMGAEIAKVSLWLHAFVPGVPLADLDHNIQCGNALIGVARADAVSGAGREVATLCDAIAEATALGARKAAAIRRIDDATPGDLESNRVAGGELREAVRGARTIFDLWTAEPLGLAGARDEALVHGAELLAGRPSTLADRAAELGRREGFLHWPLAFAEVFARERPGFDAVVGNPPWEEITVEELAFYARHRPGLRGMAAEQRDRALADLRAERPQLARRLAGEQQRMTTVRASFGPASGYTGTPGDPDVYKLFCQRYRAVLRDGGALGVVLPRSAFVAKGSTAFRAWLFEHAAPQRIDTLVNRGMWAFDMEPRYSVALLVARSGGAGDERFELAGPAGSMREFAAQVAGPGVRMRREALGRHHEIPSLASQEAADLLAKLRAGPPFPFGGGQWQCFAVREFDETNDRRLWEGAGHGRPLWKGASFDQYDPHGADARRCPASAAALATADKRRPGSESLVAERVTLKQRRDAVQRTRERARVAFRDVSRATDSRTVRACLLPPAHFLTNKAPYLAFVDDDPRHEAACLAVCNSLAFDWQARRFVEINLNFFILEGLRLPDLDPATVAALAEPAARLSCPDKRFAGFAAATAVEVGPLPAHERDALRAGIDALVAHAYGLTTDELEVVFSDFTRDAVAPAYRELVRERFAAL